MADIFFGNHRNQDTIYSGALMPAISNLPIYNAGAIIHVEPDPEPVDPEPTPAWATKFTDIGGLTTAELGGFFGTGSCSSNILGTDSVTGFDPPFDSPLYCFNRGYSDGWSNYGVAINSSMGGWYYGAFPTMDVAGAAAKVTIANPTVTVRGVSQKALRMTFRAPGAQSDYQRQMWWWLRRSQTTDLSTFTIRYEIQIPVIPDVLFGPPSYTGRYILLDIKDFSDFRYIVEVMYTLAGDVVWSTYADRNSVNNYGVNQFNPANNSGNYFWQYQNSSVDVPQAEKFTIEYSWIRSNSMSDLTNGRFRVRIRKESDSATTWTTIFDISQSSVAAANALNGTTYQNRHRSPITNATTSHIQRVMMGLYGRFKNVDVTQDIAHWRCFTTFDV